MFALEVVLVGLETELRRSVEQELIKYPAQVVAAYPELAGALEELRTDRDHPRVLVLQYGGELNEAGMRRLAATLPGWPMIALVDRARGAEGLVQANRAGAVQVVPLPLDLADFQSAVSALGAQFNLNPPEGQVIAFSSVSGGCGATSLAINAAESISGRRGERCILMELAARLGAVATNLNLDPRATLPDLVQQSAELDPYLLEHALTPFGESLLVLAGPQAFMPTGWAKVDKVRGVIELARKIVPVVVLDVPSTFDELEFEVLGAANRIVLVGLQSIAAVRALKLVCDALGPRRLAQGAYFVLNQYDPGVQGLTADEIGKALSLPGIRTVPRDSAAMATALNRGQPLRQVAPTSPVLEAVDSLVDQLLQAHAKATPGSTWLSRLFGSGKGGAA